VENPICAGGLTAIFLNLLIPVNNKEKNDVREIELDVAPAEKNTD
jgi:xanthine/uracil permease